MGSFLNSLKLLPCGADTFGKAKPRRLPSRELRCSTQAPLEIWVPGAKPTPPSETEIPRPPGLQISKMRALPARRRSRTTRRRLSVCVTPFFDVECAPCGRRSFVNFDCKALKEMGRFSPFLT